MALTLRGRKGRSRRGRRRGQSEVIGGLIVLTLLFAFATPLLLSNYYSGIRTGTQVQQNLAATQTAFNEKITVTPIPPTSPLAKIAYPAVYINNTGTVRVVISKVILLDRVNNTVYAILDMRYARNGTNPLVYGVLVNVTGPSLLGAYQPPPGQPIVLQPGESMLLMFNKSLASIAQNLIVLVETGRGLLMPNAGAGASGPQLTLAGTSTTSGVLAKQYAWRGIFSPQSGFILRGAADLEKEGNYYTWTPPLLVMTLTAKYSWWGIYLEPNADGFQSTFIYDDVKYAGLYRVTWVPNSTYFLYVYDRNNGTYYYFEVSSYNKIIIYGYVGSYDTHNNEVWIDGFAFAVYIQGSFKYWINGVYQGWSGNYLLVDNRPVNLGTDGITTGDLDGNGVSELVFYSLMNGPTVASPYDVDADAFVDNNFESPYSSLSSTSTLFDSPVWTYMVARDISGVNYIKVTAKINYYWTDTFSSATGCPTWAFRKLKLFSLVIWKYNETSGEWEIYQAKDFIYTNAKPYQFQITGIFPVDANGTYRVGVMFYDNYRSWLGYYTPAGDRYDCYKDFTYGLEHLIVEYGIYNPLFQQSPPLYIIAIPNTTIINDIGEKSYQQAYNISNIDTAKIDAQNQLLQITTDELNASSISGYSIIRNQSMLCNLLFSPTSPPKYAVILWLQGNVSIYDVTRGYCNIDDDTLAKYIADYHWIWAWPLSTPFGDINAITTYNTLATYKIGNYTANITSYGLAVKKKAVLWYLFSQIPYRIVVNISDTSMILNESTFYATNVSGTTYYGDIAFWLYNPGLGITSGSGVVVVNPVAINWTYPSSIWLTWNPTNKTDVPPQTAIEAALYSALYAWNTLTK